MLSRVQAVRTKKPTRYWRNLVKQELASMGTPDYSDCCSVEDCLKAACRQLVRVVARLTVEEIIKQALRKTARRGRPWRRPRYLARRW